MGHPNLTEDGLLLVILVRVVVGKVRLLLSHLVGEPPSLGSRGGRRQAGLRRGSVNLMLPFHQLDDVHGLHLPKHGLEPGLVHGHALVDLAQAWDEAVGHPKDHDDRCGHLDEQTSAIPEPDVLDDALDFRRRLPVSGHPRLLQPDAG